MYPATVRQEALARLAGGDSLPRVAGALEVSERTVRLWRSGAREKLPEIAAPVRERLAFDAAAAVEMCIERTVKALPMARLRDAAYAAKCMSEIALDWGEGRRGMPATGGGGDGTQAANAFGEMSVADPEEGHTLCEFCEADGSAA